MSAESTEHALSEEMIEDQDESVNEETPSPQGVGCEPP
jgi:spoIIIJ-associated protein